MAGDWIHNWHEILSGPERLRGISRYPEYRDDQDFSDAIIDPVLEAVGRLVDACSSLEIALFQALASLDRRYAFTEAERLGPKGCVKRLRAIAPQLKPVRPRQARRRTTLEQLLDDAAEHLELRNGVVHGRSGRRYMSEVYESRRWVLEKGQEPRLITTVYDRKRLILAAVRASNVAADLLDGLEDWELQKGRIRREQRQALGQGHAMRIEKNPDGQEHRDILHALSTDGLSTLCGIDASTMGRYLVPHDKTGEPDHDLLFEDSNRRYHCRTCQVASGLAGIT